MGAFPLTVGASQEDSVLKIEIPIEVYTTMPGIFRATNPKLDTATECVEALTIAWNEFIEARIAYADARMNFNWSHKGHRDNPERASEKISAAYDDYFEKMDTFKTAHTTYKTAIRELLRGHLL